MTWENKFMNYSLLQSGAVDWIENNTTEENNAQIYLYK